MMSDTDAPLSDAELRSSTLPGLALAVAAGRVSKEEMEAELARRERELDRQALRPAPTTLDVRQRASGEREDD